MSKYDYKDPGTDPAYCDPLRAEDDIDVPDFDEPYLGGGALSSDLPIDPAEHAAHALIDALTTLEQQIALCSDKDLERANQLRKMVHRHEQQAALVLNKATAKVDEILERRR